MPGPPERAPRRHLSVQQRSGDLEAGKEAWRGGQKEKDPTGLREQDAEVEASLALRHLGELVHE